MKDQFFGLARGKMVKRSLLLNANGSFENKATKKSTRIRPIRLITADHRRSIAQCPRITNFVSQTHPAPLLGRGLACLDDA